jgi:hypothetical protein
VTGPVTRTGTGTGAGSAPATFRCSAASLDLDEPLEGTASTVRAFLLLEADGPWGVDAVRDSRLPPEVKRRLADLQATHRVRPLLMRRHAREPKGRAGGGAGVSLFAAYVHTDLPWVETTRLRDARELLDLDLAGLGEGRSPGLAAQHEPLLLACTHGRHDACCAERGRPLAAAMSSAAPDHTWEVSHIGGDRFAANVLVLPYGLYYGRLFPDDAADFARRHLAGELDLEHLRGRSAYPFSVQAAEVYLRRQTGVTRIEPLPLVEHTRHGTATRAVFVVDGRPWEVRVHTEPGEGRRLTCRATVDSAGLGHRLEGIRALEDQPLTHGDRMDR